MWSSIFIGFLNYCILVVDWRGVGRGEKKKKERDNVKIRNNDVLGILSELNNFFLLNFICMCKGVLVNIIVER